MDFGIHCCISSFGWLIDKSKEMKTIGLVASIILSTMAVNDNTIYQFAMNSIEGTEINLADYNGKVVLIVNVASECGFTPQYAELQTLYDQHKDEGLVILGFPANNFGAQEPGSNEEIQAFCEKNYGVTFPMFSKISVKGDDMHPLYQFLTQKEKNGHSESKVKWNFQKYLIGRDGTLREVIDPGIRVSGPRVITSIEALLAGS